MTAVARLLLVLLIAAGVLLPASGCVEESYTLREGTDIGTAEPPEPRQPEPDDPLPLIASATAFPTGDTIVLRNGQIVRLIGMRAPQQGENCFETARTFLRRLVGNRIFRLTYRTGTKYTDPVWWAHVIIPNVEDVELPNGEIIPKGAAANSVNALALAQGLAMPENIGSVQLARVSQEGDDRGKLEPLGERADVAIRELFRESVRRAEANGVNLYGDVSKP